MKHGNEPKKAYSALNKQFGSGTISHRQMGDTIMSREDREKARDNHERAQNVEDRGYGLQMG